MSYLSRGSFDSSGNMDSAVDVVHLTSSSLSLDKDVDRHLPSSNGWPYTLIPQRTGSSPSGYTTHSTKRHFPTLTTMLYIFLFLPLGSIMVRAANSIQWINPSAGASFNPGQAVEATWFVPSYSGME